MENGNVIDAFVSKTKIPGIILGIVIFIFSYYQRGKSIKEINAEIETLKIGQATIKVNQDHLQNDIKEIKTDIKELKSLILTSQKKR